MNMSSSHLSLGGENHSQGDILPIESQQSPTVGKQVANRIAGLTRELPYVELSGYKLDRENHGAPQSPRIAINEGVSSWKRPQAWNVYVKDTYRWLYNYPGALEEARYLGRKIPSYTEWNRMFLSCAGKTGNEISQIFNISHTGFYDSGSGILSEVNEYEHIWTETDYGPMDAYFVFIGLNGDLNQYWRGRERGLSLRFFSPEDTKSTYYKV